MFAVFVKSWKMNLPISTLTCLRSIGQVSTFNASCPTIFRSPQKKPASCTGAFVQTPAKAAEDFGSTWRNTSCLKPQLWEVKWWMVETFWYKGWWFGWWFWWFWKKFSLKKVSALREATTWEILEVYDTYLTYLIFLLGWLFCVGKCWCMWS